MINQGVRQELGSIRMASGLNKQTKPKNEGKAMNNKFDELAKGLAQSVTRRQALRRFGTGVGAFLLAAVGLPRNAYATKTKDNGKDMYNGFCVVDGTTGTLSGACNSCANGVSNAAYFSPDCAVGAAASGVTTPCGYWTVSSTKCKFVAGL